MQLELAPRRLEGSRRVEESADPGPEIVGSGFAVAIVDPPTEPAVDADRTVADAPAAGEGTFGGAAEYVAVAAARPKAKWESTREPGQHR